MANIPYQDVETLGRQQVQIIEQQATTITRLEAENRDLRDQLEVMHFRLSQMSRRIYGNVSERIIDDAGQAYLPGFGPRLSADETVDTDDTDDDPDDNGGGGGGRKKRQNKKRGGRLKLPDHLPRVDRIIEPDSEARARHPHADRLVKIREEVTEKLDYVAGGFQVVRLIRPVYGIPHSDDMTVSAAPPAQVVQRGLPTDRVVAMVLSEQFDLHNPLYRQQSRFQRAGIALPRATLSNWIGAATDHLAPIVQALRDEIHTSPVIGLDDTTIQRLAPGKGRTHTGRFWGYASQHSCVITYADSRSGAFPTEFLKNYSGAIVADAYSGHEPLYVDGTKRHIPCMAPIRRKFVDASRDAGDTRAKPVIDHIRQLYDLEKDLHGQPPDVIKRCRDKNALPILQQLHQIITTLAQQAIPKSPLGSACTYFLNRWPRLHHYCDDGCYPIDNNALERLWKPVALGRKKYLFVGSETGGHRAAAASSITLSCRLNNSDPYHYLCDVFADLHTGDKDPASLTPATWAKNNHAQVHVAA